MYKMANIKYHIAKWRVTDSVGGIALAGFFEKTSEIIRGVDGKEKRITQPIKGVTLYPSKGYVIEKIGRESYDLEIGDFLVQNIEENLPILKSLCKKGWIRMDDWDLQEEFLEVDLGPKLIDEVRVDETVVEDLTAPNAPSKVKEKKKTITDKLKNGKNKK
jgi:hypothetical protein